MTTRSTVVTYTSDSIYYNYYIYYIFLNVAQLFERIAKRSGSSFFGMLSTEKIRMADSADKADAEIRQLVSDGGH